MQWIGGIISQSKHTFLAWGVYLSQCTWEMSTDFLDTVHGHNKSVTACLQYKCYKDFIETYHPTETVSDEKSVKLPFLCLLALSSTVHLPQCRPFSSKTIQFCNAWLGQANHICMLSLQIVTFRNLSSRLCSCFALEARLHMVRSHRAGCQPKCS